MSRRTALFCGNLVTVLGLGARGGVQVAVPGPRLGGRIRAVAPEVAPRMRGSGVLVLPLRGDSASPSAHVTCRRPRRHGAPGPAGARGSQSLQIEEKIQTLLE